MSETRSGASKDFIRQINAEDKKNGKSSKWIEKGEARDGE